MLQNYAFKVVNFGAAGTTTLVSKMIPAHLEPDSPGVIIYNGYIE
jgi:hypothetical protein